MKKLLLIVPMLFLFVMGTQAQELSKETKKAVKQANRALNAFKVNNSAKDKLVEAKQEIDKVFAEMPDASKAAYSLNMKGEIYNEIANQYLAIKQLGISSTDELPEADNPPVVAFNAYKEALNYIDKSREENDAIDGILVAQRNMNQYGAAQYENQEYEKAFESFSSMFEAHDILKEKGSDSDLDNEERYNDMMYFTGLAAYSAQKMEEVNNFFKPLYEMGTDKGLVYQILYEINAKDDPQSAYKYIEKGRELLPEDVSILFAEINHFLKMENIDKLLEKLDLAIEKEPKNVSLYFTKGNVYDKLYQQAIEEEDSVAAQKNFDAAIAMYDQALEIDPNFVDAVYGKGALYYNKAAGLTRELTALADDYTKKGIAKYEAKKEQVFEEFEKALPYFQKAESIDPNDLNTLIALKEIYARKNELDISQEFAKRLQIVRDGGKNESSYFDK